MTNYTAAEHKTITAAWAALIDYAETRGRMGERQELRNILADTRRQMDQPGIDAKALLASAFVEAVFTVRDNINLAELWQNPRPIREITCYAWHTDKRDGPTDELWASMMGALREAREARKQAKIRASGLTQREIQEVQS